MKLISKMRIIIVSLLMLVGTAGAVIDDYIVYFPLNESSGTNTVDMNSTTQNNGTLTNMNTGLDNCTGNCSGWNSSGRYYNGLSFDGVNDYVTAGNGADFNITNAITIMGWVHSDNYNQAGKYLFGKGASSYGVRIYSTGYAFLRLYNGTSASPDAYTTTLLSNNTWYHVAITYDKDGGSNNIKIYLNGVLETQKTWAGGLLNIDTSPFVLGTRGDSITGNNFKGRIDEVRLYNHTLTNDEINSSMNNGQDFDMNTSQKWVRLNGNDSCNGQNNMDYGAWFGQNLTSCAWKTIAYSATQAVSGDTINIVSGNYGHEHIVNSNSGTVANPIIFQGYDGIANINGTDMSSGRGIDTNDQDNISFKNINLTYYYDAVYGNYSDNLTFDNVNVNLSGNYGVILDRSNYSTYRNSTINEVRYGLFAQYAKQNIFEDNIITGGTYLTGSFPNFIESGYYILLVYTNDSIIRRNTIRSYNLTGTGHGIGIKDNPSWSGNHSTNNTLENNTIYETYEPLFIAHGAYGNTLQNNIINSSVLLSSAAQQGVTIRDGSYNNTAINISITSNNSGRGITLEATGEAATYVISRNNTFKNIKTYNTSACSKIYDSDNTTIESSTFSGGRWCLQTYNDTSSRYKNVIITNFTDELYNIYFGDNPGDVSFTYSDFFGNAWVAPAGTGNIDTNPLFVSSIDYHLQSQYNRWNGTAWVQDASTSPAIGAGDPTTVITNCPSWGCPTIVEMGAYGNTEEASQGTPELDYIPPNVTFMTYTNGSLWVNHTWQPGTGNITDSYNISHNGIWSNGTSLNYSNNTVGAGAWSNITVYSYNSSGNGTLNATAISQNVQTPILLDYIPPSPLTDSQTINGLTINTSWTAGIGNITDTYNISDGLTSLNGTSATFASTTFVVGHQSQNLTVYAYNTSGNGKLNNTPYILNTTLPNNPILISGISISYNINEGQILSIDANYSDIDLDTGTFADNSTEWDVNSSTGIVSWITNYSNAGVYYWQINVSDGYGSINSTNFTVTVNNVSIIPPSPITLSYSNSSTWVNHTWLPGSGNITDGYNISHNGTWQNSTNNYSNNSIGYDAWSNITVWAYNATDEQLSATSVSQQVHTPTETFDAPNINYNLNNITLNSATDITVNVNNGVLFSAGANQTITSWDWSGANEVSGDGTTNSTATQHFSAIGDFIVYGNATNANGTDSLSWTIHVVASGGGGTQHDQAEGWVKYANGTAIENVRVIVNNSDNNIEYTNAFGYYDYTYVFHHGETYWFNFSKAGHNNVNVSIDFLVGTLQTVNITMNVTTISAPIITSWGNDNTSNNNTTLTVLAGTNVTFNITANETISSCIWTGATPINCSGGNSSAYKVFSAGVNTVTARGTNANGSTQTITWTVTATQPNYMYSIDYSYGCNGASSMASPTATAILGVTVTTLLILLITVIFRYMGIGTASGLLLIGILVLTVFALLPSVIDSISNITGCQSVTESLNLSNASDTWISLSHTNIKNGSESVYNSSYIATSSSDYIMGYNNGTIFPLSTGNLIFTP